MKKYSPPINKLLEGNIKRAKKQGGLKTSIIEPTSLLLSFTDPLPRNKHILLEKTPKDKEVLKKFKRYKVGFYFMAFIFIILLSTFSSALTTYEQDTSIDLKHPVRVDGAIVNNLNCNISVYYPNNTILIDFLSMTDNGDYFNYTLDSTLTHNKGTYPYSITCSNGTLSQTENFEFLLNYGGIEPTNTRNKSSQMAIYIFFGLGILIFISMFLVKPMPLKLTLFLIMVWFFLMGMNATFISLQDEVVNLRMEGFFDFFLSMGFLFNWFAFFAIIMIWFISFLVTLIERKKLKMIDKYGY